jgi:hypothetical protein
MAAFSFQSLTAIAEKDLAFFFASLRKSNIVLAVSVRP